MFGRKRTYVFYALRTLISGCNPQQQRHVRGEHTQSIYFRCKRRLTSCHTVQNDITQIGMNLLQVSPNSLHPVIISIFLHLSMMKEKMTKCVHRL